MTDELMQNGPVLDLLLPHSRSVTALPIRSPLQDRMVWLMQVLPSKGAASAQRAKALLAHYKPGAVSASAAATAASNAAGVFSGFSCYPIPWWQACAMECCRGSLSYLTTHHHPVLGRAVQEVTKTDWGGLDRKSR